MSQQGLTHRNVWKWLIKHFILRSKIDIQPKKVHMYVSMYTYTHIHTMRIKNTWAKSEVSHPQWRAMLTYPVLWPRTHQLKKRKDPAISQLSLWFTQIFQNYQIQIELTAKDPKHHHNLSLTQFLSSNYVYLIVSIDGHGHFPGFQTYNWKENTQQLAELSLCSLNIKSEQLL